MAFCTIVEWVGAFDLEGFNAMIEEAGGHENLPDGCLSRIVSAAESGARVIEVWESNEDARKFADRVGPSLGQFQVRPPDRVAAFETTFYQAR
jgi:hypothetical protein